MSESKVIPLRLKCHPNRNHAINWLMINHIVFPQAKSGYIGKPLFHGWRFICAEDGCMYFANCLDRGITEQEVINQGDENETHYAA